MRKQVGTTKPPWKGDSRKTDKGQVCWNVYWNKGNYLARIMNLKSKKNQGGTAMKGLRSHKEMANSNKIRTLGPLAQRKAGIWLGL